LGASREGDRSRERAPRVWGGRPPRAERPGSQHRVVAARSRSVHTRSGHMTHFRSRKRLFAFTLLAGVVIAASVAVYLRGFGRIAMGLTLFHGAEQAENFSRAAQLFPTTTMPKSRVPFRFPQGEQSPLPKAFVYEGRTTDVDELLAETDTSALLVLKDGEVRFDRYYQTGGPDVHWLSWSVAQRVVSALLRSAGHAGHTASIEDRISEYVPLLRGSGYDGVRIKDVLQMSSGVRWDETYVNPFSDVNRFGAVLFLGGSLDAFTASLVREREPGTFNHYSSADT